MKIEIISGSPRKQSQTRRVAYALQQFLELNSTHQIGLIDMQEWQLPPVQSVWRSVEETPENYRMLAERMFKADAFILVTPEYNGSYSPALKNMLDHFPKQAHKAFGIVTASPGAMGGMRAAQQLLTLVPALFGIASPHLLLVPAVDKKFQPSGELAEPGFSANIENFVKEFLWLAERISREEQVPALKKAI